MRKSEQESETAEQYEVRWRLDKDADKKEGRGVVDSGVRNSDGDGTVGLLSSGESHQLALLGTVSSCLYKTFRVSNYGGH